LAAVVVVDDDNDNDDDDDVGDDDDDDDDDDGDVDGDDDDDGVRYYDCNSSHITQINHSTYVTCYMCTISWGFVRLIIFPPPLPPPSVFIG